MTTQRPSLGARLRQARTTAGLSVRELASLAGIHHSYLVKLETDQNANPSADKLQRLAEVLKLDSAELLTYIGVEPSLPEPRVYFRRKLGVNAEQAEVLAHLVADFQAKHKGGGTHEDTNSERNEGADS